MNPSVSFNEGPRQPIAATLFAFEDIGEGGPYRGIVDVDLPCASQCIQVPLAVDRMIFEPTSNLAQCPPQEGGVVAFTSRNQEVPEPFDLVCSEESICDADLGDALFFCFGQVVAECGDGRVDFPEACDGPTACSSLGFSGGTAGCNATCDLVDTSGCSVCGNGIIEEGEACDDPQDPSCFQCHRFLSEIEPNDDGTPDVGSGGISPNDFSSSVSSPREGPSALAPVAAASRSAVLQLHRGLGDDGALDAAAAVVAGVGFALWRRQGVCFPQHQGRSRPHERRREGGVDGL